MEEQLGVNNEVKSPIMLRNDEIPKPIMPDIVDLPKPNNYQEIPTRVSREPLPTFKEMKKETKKENSPALWTSLLSVLLIATFMFSLKFYEPADNLILTGGIYIYPLTFLIVAIICKFYGFKSARKSIFASVLAVLIFTFITMLCVIPDGNSTSMQYNAIIQYIFANDSTYIGNFRIFYPTLGQYFGVLISFIISHLLYATIYNVTHKITIETLSIGLSLFIAYILDRIIFIFLLFSEGLMKKTNTFDFVIKCLTSEFMAAIAVSVLIIIVMAIIIAVTKNKNNKKIA